MADEAALLCLVTNIACVLYLVKEICLNHLDCETRKKSREQDEIFWIPILKSCFQMEGKDKVKVISLPSPGY